MNIPITKVIISDDEKKAVMDVLDSGAIASGKVVEEFENKFADYIGCKYAIAVNSGTAALHAAIYALNLKENDEVITTPFTFIATANPVLLHNAKVIFADIDEKTFCISPEKIKEKITPNTKAIITVDLYGNMCNYNEILKIAKDNNLIIIEDSCQAHGSMYNNVKAGNVGDISCFSFYPTKNMMTGEGGMITTNNDNFAKIMKSFRNHGQSSQYEYDDIGLNYRMMNIQATIGIKQLEKLPDFIKKRRNNANYYYSNLSNVDGLILPYVDENVFHSFHQFTIKIDKEKFGISRDELFEYLNNNGIGARIYYPKPLHMHKNFLKLSSDDNDFPISKEISEKVISLPVHPYITTEELEYVVKIIKRAKK
jgi:perosamine synthetase